jgi:hypothetical protein
MDVIFLLSEGHVMQLASDGPLHLSHDKEQGRHSSESPVLYDPSGHVDGKGSHFVLSFKTKPLMQELHPPVSSSQSEHP